MPETRMPENTSSEAHTAATDQTEVINHFVERYKQRHLWRSYGADILKHTMKGSRLSADENQSVWMSFYSAMQEKGLGSSGQDVREVTDFAERTRDEVLASSYELSEAEKQVIERSWQNVTQALTNAPREIPEYLRLDLQPAGQGPTGATQSTGGESTERPSSAGG